MEQQHSMNGILEAPTAVNMRFRVEIRTHLANIRE